MKKYVLSLALCFILLSGCDPVSVSKIYILNSTNTELIIKAETRQKGPLEKQLKKGKKVLFFNAHSLDMKAVEPSKAIISFQILNTNRDILRSFKSTPELYTLFKKHTDL